MDDELSLVSSLYGRGTVLCWLLTILSCLISWTCDSHKRKSDSLNADFIAILTLPSVAAAHTVYQTGCLEALSDIDATRIVKYSRAIEASLTVTETFMIMSVLLFLVVFPARCYKRAFLTALVGLLCLATEYVVYSRLTNSKSRNLRGITVNFTRSFVSDTAIILTVVLALVLACISIAFCLALYVFNRIPQRPRGTIPSNGEILRGVTAEIEMLQVPEAIINEIGRHHEAELSREDRFMYLSAFSLLLLPLSFLFSLMGMDVGPRGLSASKPESLSWWSGLIYVLRRFFAAFFPETTAGLSDLDQAVAAAAGGVVLVLALWGVGSKWYTRWTAQRKTRLLEKRREEIRLRELRRRLAVLVDEA